MTNLAHLRFLNKSEIYIEDIEEEATFEDDYHVKNQHHEGHNHQVAASTASRAAITLICVYDDVIKNPKDQIKWYFNKHRIRSSLDDPHGNQITIMSRHPDSIDGMSDQFSSSFSPNHHFTITQSLSEDKNTTISSLTIHNFNLKYNYGRYRCQYKGLVKTVKIYPNHKNGIEMFCC